MKSQFKYLEKIIWMVSFLFFLKLTWISAGILSEPISPLPDSVDLPLDEVELGRQLFKEKKYRPHNPDTL
jgi:hypothetical protein